MAGDVSPDGSGGGPATGEPISLGAICSRSGIASFPEAGVAAQAVFDRFNEQGGLDGRPVELVVEDDGSDAAKAATAAGTLVEDQKVVGMVGGASLLACAAAGQYRADQGVYSILGTGVDPVCFRNDHIAAVNTGPFFSAGIDLTYLSQNLGLENVCFLGLNVPDLIPSYREIVTQWEEATGQTLTAFVTIEAQDDPTVGLTSLRSAGCDGVTMALIEPVYLAYIQAAIAGGFTEDYQIMMLTSGYSSTLAEALGPDGDGIPANSEFEPFTGDCACLDDFKGLMEANDIPLTSFATGGYLAGNLALTALQSIDGEITAESVGTAFQALNVETSLLGAPFVWGTQPNHTSKIVEMQDGGWVTVGDANEWITFPPEG
ncbi:MAG: ABC transporter substrate-binding protein [Acidimicrobiales bacterium]